MNDIFRYIQRAAFNAAFQQFGTQNVQQLIDLEIGLAQHFNGFAGVVQLKRRFNVTEVKTRLYFATRVIDRVTRFLKINFRDNIERWHLFLSLHF